MRQRRSFSPANTLSSQLLPIALAIAAFLPAFFLPFVWISVVQSKVLIVAALVFAGACLWAWDAYRNEVTMPPPSPVAYAVFALALAYTVSALFSGDGASAFVDGSGIEFTAAVMWILAAITIIPGLAFDSADVARSLVLRALIAGGLALMAVQIVHLIVPSLTLGVLSAPAQSVFGSWQSFGVIAGGFVLVALMLARSDYFSHAWDIALIVLGVLSALMLLIVNLPDIWYVLALFCTIAAGAAWLRSREQRHRLSWHRPAVLIAAAIICAAAGLGSSFLYAHLPSRLQVLEADVRPSWSATFVIAAHEYHGARAALIGSGPGSFARDWRLYKSEAINASPYWNLPFTSGAGMIPTALATTGLVGVLAWLALLIACGLRIVQSAMQPDDAGSAALAVGAGYLIVFLVISVADFGLVAAALVMIGALCAEHIDHRSRYRATLDRPAALLIFGLAAIAIAIACLYTIRAVVSDALASRAVAAYATTNDSAQALSRLDAALRVYPQNSAADLSAAQIALATLGPLTAASGTSQTELQNAVSKVSSYAIDAARIDAGDYETWIASGSLYASLGALGLADANGTAVSSFTRAHSLDPYNPEPLLGLAQVAYAQHQTADAQHSIADALALKPDYLPAILVRAQMEADAKNYAAAEADATALTQEAPQDPSSWYALGAVYMAEGGSARALSALQRAYQLQGIGGSAGYLLGLAYDAVGQHDTALALFTELARENPQNGALAQIVDNIEAGKPALSQEASVPLAASSTATH